jgi:protein arginine kinase activator
MKCQRCDKPAVVHEVIIKGDEQTELHLCEEHAAEAGLVVPTQQPIDQLLTKFIFSQGGQKRKESRSRACETCGLSFREFRKGGTLGCADCYAAFRELEGLIRRAQGGATHHVGKAPRRAGCSIDLQMLRQRLARQLDEAVAAEQYERAAELRDRLLTLDAEPASDPVGEGPEAGAPAS